MSEPLALTIYRCAAALMRPVLPLWLRWRAAHGKEVAARVRERYGIATQARPAGPVVWLHAASLGETQSVLGLVDRITSTGTPVVLTTGTVSSAEMLRGKNLPGVIHQFAPLDHPVYIARFLDHWRPNVCIRVESEIWPLTLATIAERGLPSIVVNGRLSPRAVQGWRKRPALARHVFGQLTLVLAQSNADRDAFMSLGVAASETTGNIKSATPALAGDAASLEHLTAMIGARPRWLAASIHPGEEAIVGQAHLTLRAQCPDVLTIIVPRHPDKARMMAETLSSLGISVARRSAGDKITPATGIYIADTFGELGTFYHLCRIVFIGKTFAVGGGQNPIEPAQLGCALLFGPDMSNFPSDAERLTAAGAAARVAAPSDLGGAILHLIQNPQALAHMCAAAATAAAPDLGPLDRTFAALQPYLDPDVLR